MIEISKVERRDQLGGTWVSGVVMGFRFQALVFADHAESSEYEIGTSRISKLWLQAADRSTAYNWDRGADVAATSPEAQEAVDFLECGLADFVFAC
jgi:hypothetical protein